MSLQYSGAGDLPMLLIDAATRSVRKIVSDGPLLGIFSGSEYNNFEFPLQKGDCCLLFTDGITDSRNFEGSAFGYDRMTTAIEADPHGDPYALLISEFSNFTGSHFDDDVTLIGITALR